MHLTRDSQPDRPADTPRARFRWLAKSDIDRVVEMHRDPAISRYTFDADLSKPDEVAQQLVHVEEAAAEARGFGGWAVERKADGEFLGFCLLGLSPAGDPEMGMRLCRAAWGLGLSTEIGTYAVAHAICGMGLPYVTQMVDARNRPARVFLEAGGCRRLKGQAVLHGRTLVAYAAERTPWQQRYGTSRVPRIDQRLIVDVRRALRALAADDPTAGSAPGLRV